MFVVNTILKRHGLVLILTLLTGFYLFYYFYVRLRLLRVTIIMKSLQVIDLLVFSTKGDRHYVVYFNFACACEMVSTNYALVVLCCD